MSERRSVLQLVAQAAELAVIAAVVCPPDFWVTLKRSMLLAGVVVTRNGSQALGAAQDRLLDAYRRETAR
jgi:hypothetical protein